MTCRHRIVSALTARGATQPTRDEASELSLTDLSSGRRGGLRSHHGSGGRTRDQIYNEAKAKGVPGRSKMTKAQLEEAVGR